MAGARTDRPVSPLRGPRRRYSRCAITPPRINVARSLLPLSSTPPHPPSPSPVALTLFVLAASLRVLPHGFHRRICRVLRQARQGTMCIIHNYLFSLAINTNSLSFSGARRGNAFLRLQPVPMRFAVCCSAKQDTVEKVCEIVKKQLAVPEGTEVCGTTKFSDLGADSLDTVEIVMGLEEEFQISVEETSAQAIATVEDAATLIDKLVSAKSS
ncbi:hypothetical protein ACQJBY_064430 [Aegilops geniculata]